MMGFFDKDTLHQKVTSLDVEIIEIETVAVAIFELVVTFEETTEEKVDDTEDYQFRYRLALLGCIDL
ncbi:unnamed protein product, partial [Iphiclides podalirius]